MTMGRGHSTNELKKLIDRWSSADYLLGQRYAIGGMAYTITVVDPERGEVLVRGTDGMSRCYPLENFVIRAMCDHFPEIQALERL